MKLSNPLVLLGLVVGIVVVLLAVFEAGKNSTDRQAAAPRSTPETAARPSPANSPDQSAAVTASPGHISAASSDGIAPHAQPTPMASVPPAPVASDHAQAAAKQEACTSVSGMARTIMENRHKGVAMSKMMAIEMDPAIAEVTKALIMAAYEGPRYSTPEMQEKAAQDFENEAFLTCIKEFNPVS